MPRFDPNVPMQSRRLAGTTYGYSGTRLDALSSSEYTLISIAADQSGSVSSFRVDIERCLGEIVRACQRSARAEQLMMRLSAFDDSVHEVHGFKPMPTLDPKDYVGSVRPGGCTALYDASLNAIGAVRSYGDTLAGRDFTVNGLVFVITDGSDNASAATADRVREELAAAVQSERLDSIRAVLVGVMHGRMDPAHPSPDAAELMRFSATAGFDDFIALDQADATQLERLAQFASRSIALQSTALGTGSASVSLTF